MIILAVDDDAEDFEFFSEAIKEIDFSIIILKAANGNEALHIFVVRHCFACSLLLNNRTLTFGSYLSEFQGQQCPTYKRSNMEKAKKAKMVLLVSAIVIELAAVIMIAKAYATHSSPTPGITLLTIGLVFLVIGITRKSENDKSEPNWRMVGAA